ncbi:hypothetical protein [Tomitella biformata]|uniref:hypothetical protein n=1 Tax=Tomitella biformata TaxID=630403 RepID=UPI000466C8A5|nr:hypothetical protein [Tomitella biformata]
MSDHVSKVISKFVAEHGGSARAVLQPVGRRGIRITLVGSDGILGDQMVETMAEAEAAIAANPSVTRSEWDRELVSVATPEPAHARRMAGLMGRG